MPVSKNDFCMVPCLSLTHMDINTILSRKTVGSHCGRSSLVFGGFLPIALLPDELLVIPLSPFLVHSLSFVSFSLGLYSFFPFTRQLPHGFVTSLSSRGNVCKYL